MMTVTDGTTLRETSRAKHDGGLRHNDSRMEPPYWIAPDTASLLDVGCNTGDFLETLRLRYPRMELAGVDINEPAIATAKSKVPDAHIQQGFGFDLPFPDNRFDCVTCIEVIEHVPQQFRAQLISEMRRVLKPGGLMMIRCPHAGIFSFLDAQNFRFRFPGLYMRLVGEGGRDVNYRDAKEELVWHHHFTRDELVGLAGSGWDLQACEYGGLLLFPISDILRWPFYRMKRPGHWFARMWQRIATFELGVSFGRSSYGILMVWKKL